MKDSALQPVRRRLLPCAARRPPAGGKFPYRAGGPQQQASSHERVMGVDGVLLDSIDSVSFDRTASRSTFPCVVGCCLIIESFAAALSVRRKRVGINPDISSTPIGPLTQSLPTAVRFNFCLRIATVGYRPYFSDRSATTASASCKSPNRSRKRAASCSAIRSSEVRPSISESAKLRTCPSALRDGT